MFFMFILQSPTSLSLSMLHLVDALLVESLVIDNIIGLMMY